MANVADPTGVPSSRNPFVSSMPLDEVPTLSMEYVLMEYSMSAASEGLVWRMDGMMLCPVHDVSILDFSGLMKQPLSLPSVFMLSSRNLRSAWGTVQLISSTHAKM